MQWKEKKNVINLTSYRDAKDSNVLARLELCLIELVRSNYKKGHACFKLMQKNRINTKKKQ